MEGGHLVCVFYITVIIYVDLTLFVHTYKLSHICKDLQKSHFIHVPIFNCVGTLYLAITHWALLATISILTPKTFHLSTQHYLVWVTSFLLVNRCLLTNVIKIILSIWEDKSNDEVLLCRMCLLYSKVLCVTLMTRSSRGTLLKLIKRI